LGGGLHAAVVAVPVSIAAVGYASYSTAMALGRFGGDRGVAFFGEGTLSFGTLIIVRLAAVPLVPTPFFAITRIGTGRSGKFEPRSHPSLARPDVIQFWARPRHRRRDHAGAFRLSYRTGSDRIDVEIFGPYYGSCRTGGHQIKGF
jgi:hypothetical protein